MDIAYLKREYGNRKPLLEELLTIARSTLDGAIRRKKLKVHAIPGRLKPIDSLLDKVRRTEVSDPFTEIQDIVGICVVCLLLSDVQPVKDVIRDTFDIIEEEDRIDGPAPNVFAYLSFHFTARISEMPDKSTSRDLTDIPFEIQVRTIAQDAWAAISHHLAYKQEESVPERWERNLNALSAVFYVADSHFEFLRDQLIEHRMKAVR